MKTELIVAASAAVLCQWIGLVIAACLSYRHILWSAVSVDWVGYIYSSLAACLSYRHILWSAVSVDRVGYIYSSLAACLNYRHIL